MTARRAKRRSTAPTPPSAKERATRQIRTAAAWPRPSGREWAALAAFFLSGAAGLLYEVCWIKRASLAFGSTIHALSTVLAVFFLGLALGGALFGQVSIRAKNPLRTYAWLELALAATALLTMPAFGWADQVFGSIYRFGGGASLLAGRIALVAVVLLPPTVLMGGTLPLLSRVFVRSGAAVALPVGLLYAINTLGAAAGCAVAGLVTIPSIGLRATVVLGVALNVLAAAIAWRLRIAPVADAEEALVTESPSRAPAGRHDEAAGDASHADPPRGETLLLLALVFMTGLIALGNEVLWTRFLALLVRNTVVTYTLMLTTVLAGIVAGSAVASRFGDRVTARGRLLGGTLAGGGLIVLATLLLPPEAWYALRGGFASYALLMLPAAALSGAAFPLAARMLVSRPSHAGAGVGRMTATNTVGGIVGSMVTGFVLLPALGLERALLVLTGVAVAAGIVAWLWLDRTSPRSMRFVASLAAAALWIAIPRFSGVHLPKDHLRDTRELLELREGLQANLAVFRDSGIKTLEIDRLWQGQDVRSQQVVAGHLPLLLHHDPRRVLLVGVGAGQTPAAMCAHDVERVDCVDIEPAVFDVIRDQFDHAWMNDPRVHIMVEDGRNYVAHTRERYDVISLEVGQPFRPGVGAFYTVEFYREARRHLTPNGIFSHLAPLASLPASSLNDVIATFAAAFPQGSVWYNSSDLLLIGTNGPRFEISPERLKLLSTDPRFHAGLAYSHWGGPPMALHRAPVLLGSFLLGPRGLADMARDGTVLHDDRPRLEYAARAVLKTRHNELAALPLLERHFDDVATVLGPGFPPESLRDVPDIRRGNLNQLVSGVILGDVSPTFQRGGYAALEALADSALRLSPGNPRAHRLKGDVLADQNRVAEAMRYYAYAIWLRPDYLAPRRALGILLCEQGHYEEALPQLEACLPGYPHDTELAQFLAEARAGVRKMRASGARAPRAG